MDVTEIITDHHHQQRKLFAILEDYPRDDTEGLAAIWHQLENFLLLHADAEEETFYRDLAKVGTGGGDADDNTDQIVDAIEDHNLLRDAIRRVRRCRVGSAAWWTAVTDANVANSGHMAEEERQDLADFRQQASLELRHSCAVDFLKYIATRWQEEPKAIRGNLDPEEYVEEAQSADDAPSAAAAAQLAEQQTPERSSADPAPSVQASDAAKEKAE